MVTTTPLPFATLGRHATLVGVISLCLVRAALGQGTTPTAPPTNVGYPPPTPPAPEIPADPIPRAGVMPGPGVPVNLMPSMPPGGMPGGLAPLPLAPPRPGQGADSIASFVDRLRGNDSAFEVLVGQGRILSLKVDLTEGNNQPLIAVGDPSVIEFAVASPRQLRITGLRIGVTDLSITTANDEVFTFEVRVVADLSLLEGKLRATFPDASVRLAQLRDHVVVEGEARDQNQLSMIIRTVEAYLRSVAVGQSRQVRGGANRGTAMLTGMTPNASNPAAAAGDPNQGAAAGPLAGSPLGELAAIASPEMGGPLQVSGSVAPPQVINLMRVPTSQQVLLKVRIAELNRSALRRIGSNFLGVDPDTGAIVGSQIGSSVGAVGTIAELAEVTGATANGASGASITSVPGGRALLGQAVAAASPDSTIFGIFQDANFMFTLNALRRNGFLRVLAEPNLVALNGQFASFLAGGEYPVPVPQVSASGVAPTVTVSFKEFGVRLGFIPFVMDGNRIRLSVYPEVSNIDFTVAVTLVAGGSPVPGLNTRRAQTTVELIEGQTLAIAGLLQLTLDGQTARIPGLGDLPILGPLFSNTTGSRIEKELVVLVTPYLVEPMNANQVPPTPGDEVYEPNDLEFYFENRIEGRTGNDFRSTTRWDDPYKLQQHLKLEKKYVHGPVGYSD